MTSRLSRLIGACCLAGVLIVGCGDDGGETDEADAVPSDTESDVVDDSRPADEGTAQPDGDSEGGSDDLLNQYLANVGLNSDIMATEQAACMNDELELRYPDGFPSGWESMPDVVDDVDAIAELCEVEL